MEKIEFIVPLALRISEKAERIYRILNSKLISALQKGRLNHMDEDSRRDFIHDIHKIVVPFQMQIIAQLYEVKSFEETELEQKIFDLK